MPETPWALAQSPPPIGAGDLHVWRVRLGESQYAELEGRLSATERERARRFREDVHRREWAASRAALRSVLGGYLQRPAPEVAFAIGGNGKPSLDPPCGIEFNLSHTSGLALIAVTRNNPVGVDVELLRDGLDPLLTAPAVFAPDEIARLKAASPADQLAVFLEIWTRKEAWIKMLGTGLTDDLPDYSLENPALLPESLRPGASIRLEPATTCSAAVATREGVAVVRTFEFVWDGGGNGTAT